MPFSDGSVLRDSSYAAFRESFDDWKDSYSEDSESAFVLFCPTCPVYNTKACSKCPVK